MCCTTLYAEMFTSEKGVYEISASRVLKTIDRKAAADTILAIVEQAGGWLLTDRKQSISLRIPSEAVDTLLARIDSLGIVTDRKYNRQDRTDESLQLLASLEAKESLLEQLLALLDSSQSEGIYPVSREIADLQDSIEKIKGRTNGMFERMKYAEITVWFRFADRRTPPATGHSDFEWLNTVNLPLLLKDFN